MFDQAPVNDDVVNARELEPSHKISVNDEVNSKTNAIPILSVRHQ
jgi:hypothetical protein